MTITITISTENAAFGDDERDKGAEVARILRALAFSAEYRNNLSGPILDMNGNRVGMVEVE